MLKQILFLVSICPFVIYSQRIHFKIGSEYRITPIEKNKETTGERVLVNYSRHRQLTGTSFSYSIFYQTESKLSFGISQSAQYSHLYYEKKYNSNQDKEETINSVNRILTDFKIYIEKQFSISQDNFVFIELGRSLINSGSSYQSKEFLFYNPNTGDPIFAKNENDFIFFATNITVGITAEYFDFGIGTYFINESEYEIGSFFLPYLKINYLLK